MKTKIITITLSITIILSVIINNTMKNNRIELNETKYQTCLNEAEKAYNWSWDNLCTLTTGSKECALNSLQSLEFKQVRENNKNRCLDVYKVNIEK